MFDAGGMDDDDDDAFAVDIGVGAAVEPAPIAAAPPCALANVLVVLAFFAGRALNISEMVGCCLCGCALRDRDFSRDDNGRRWPAPPPPPPMLPVAARWALLSSHETPMWSEYLGGV